MSDYWAVLMQKVIVVTGEEILFATQAYVLANCFFFRSTGQRISESSLKLNKRRIKARGYSAHDYSQIKKTEQSQQRSTISPNCATQNRDSDGNL